MWFSGTFYCIIKLYSLTFLHHLIASCYKGIMHWYWSHAITCYFTGCDVIVKCSFKSLQNMNTQRWKNYVKWNLNVLVSIVRARKVVIMNVMMHDSVACYLLMLHYSYGTMKLTMHLVLYQNLKQGSGGMQ